MSFFGLFKEKKPQSASLAKERLKIIVEHSRATNKHPVFLEKMRREILEVVNKYTQVDLDAIDASIVNQGESDVLELNIVLPDNVELNGKKQDSQKNSK